MHEQIEQLRADLLNERKKALECDCLQERRKVLSETIEIFNKYFPPPPPIVPLTMWKDPNDDVRLGLVKYTIVIGFDDDGKVQYCVRDCRDGLLILRRDRPVDFHRGYVPITDPDEIKQAKAWVCEGKVEEDNE